MGVSDIKDEIQDYAGAGYDVKMDNLMYTQMVLQDTVNYILGLAVWGVAIGLTLITAFDVAYITIPPLQEMVRKHNWDGALTKSRIRFVSTDARNAVEEAASRGEGAVGIYLSKRLKTYCISVFIVIAVGFGSGAIAGVIAKILIGIISGFTA